MCGKAYVYMIRCENNHLYTGWTNNPEERFKAHKNGTGAKYTKAFKAVEMVYLEELPNKSEAMKREAVIKKLSKVQKEELFISKCNILWKN